jgi:hypothetical protein
MLVLLVTQAIIYNHRQPAQRAPPSHLNATTARILPCAFNVAVDIT